MCIRDSIYTEWYPSKGYTFNITNSTSYDQYLSLIHISTPSKP